MTDNVISLDAYRKSKIDPRVVFVREQCEEAIARIESIVKEMRSTQDEWEKQEQEERIAEYRADFFFFGAGLVCLLLGTALVGSL